MSKLIGIMHIVCFIFYVYAITEVYNFFKRNDKPRNDNNIMCLFRASYYNNIFVYYPLMFLFTIGYPLYSLRLRILYPAMTFLSLVNDCVILIGTICSIICLLLLKIDDVK